MQGRNAFTAVASSSKGGGMPRRCSGFGTIGSMDLHADLNQRVALDTTALPWTPSPKAGVERYVPELAAQAVWQPSPALE